LSREERIKVDSEPVHGGETGGFDANGAGPGE
jgi:hypothetical protein